MTTPDFQAFQHAFGRHLRDPRHSPRPAGVPARRMAVYNELLFNNITGFLDSCFPICRTLLGDNRWRRLNRTFFRDWRASTPWFREIPGQFLRYLNEGNCQKALPAWFIELAHYEWAELAIDVIAVAIPKYQADGDLLTRPIVLNPALMNLAYHWPVHRIGPGYRPRKQQATHLLVYRDANDAVQFSEINPVSARLLTLLAEQDLNGESALRLIANELQHPMPEQLIAFGSTLLNEFRQQGIILGTTPIYPPV